MENIRRPTLNRIPGLMPVAKQENLIKDLAKLTIPELLEIKEREGSLLANKAKLNRLPDKGKRIQVFYDKVLAELERQTNVDEAAAMFSQLNIAAKGLNAMNQLEWNGHLNASEPSEDMLDSDDETEMDPLRIIAQRSMHERNIKVIPPEAKLITAEDLAEIKSFTIDSPDSGLSAENSCASESTIDAPESEVQVNDNKLPTASAESSVCSTPSAPPAIEQHVLYVVEKTETCHPTAAHREKYKPYQTTITNVHDPAKERVRKKGKHWEITAATPPLTQHGSTQMLTLLDSVEIQVNYLAKLKNLQENQAAERLAARIERLGTRKIELPTSEELKQKPAFTAYRLPPTVHHFDGDPRLNEIDEVHDPLDEEKAGGVINYPIFE